MLHRLVTIGLDGKASVILENDDIDEIVEAERQLDRARTWRSEIHSFDNGREVIWSSLNVSET